MTYIIDNSNVCCYFHTLKDTFWKNLSGRANREAGQACIKNNKLLDNCSLFYHGRFNAGFLKTKGLIE